MYRLILACLTLLVLAQVSLAFPAQLEYLLNEEPEDVAKRDAEGEVMYRVRRSRERCVNNCLACGSEWSTRFDSHLCMKTCMSLTAADSQRSNKYSTCNRYYIRQPN